MSFFNQIAKSTISPDKINNQQHLNNTDMLSRATKELNLETKQQTKQQLAYY